MRHIVIPCCALAMLLGCSSEPGSEPTSTSTSAEQAQAHGIVVNAAKDGAPVYNVTHVVLNPDGTEKVFQSTITASEQKLQVAALKAERQSPTSGIRPEISQDSGCSNSQDMILFDQTGFAGNEICFSGTGTATLSSYLRAIVTCGYLCFRTYYWNDATQSYYAANVGTSTTTTDFGYFCTDTNNYCTSGNTEPWYDGVEQPTAEAAALGSATLHVCQSSYGSIFPGCI